MKEDTDVRKEIKFAIQKSTLISFLSCLKDKIRPKDKIRIYKNDASNMVTFFNYFDVRKVILK